MWISVVVVITPSLVRATPCSRNGVGLASDIPLARGMIRTTLDALLSRAKRNHIRTLHSL
jgi:hypothetical protein